MKNALLPNRLRYWLLPILALVLLISYVSQARLRPDDPTVRPGLKSAPERPKETAPKSKERRARSKQAPASNDPIRFTLQADKRQVTVGEDIELTITAQLMSISPNLIFFLPGSNAYTLKLLTPAGFQATGGDFAEYVTGELTYPTNTQATYHLRGHFTAPAEGLSFRLLRSHGQANSQSLYEEKARLQITVQAQSDGAARLADPCAGISLSAQASPPTVNVGGSVNLSATCTGCGNGGSSTLYSTNFDGEVPNTDFQTDMGDAVRVLSNAQNVSDFQYCSVGDHSGNGGKILRFNGENPGRVWEKSVSVVNGTTYTFSMWVRPVYDGTPASGNSPQTIQLKVNGGVQGSPTIAASNPGCGSGWVQLSVNWTANTTGSVPFTIQMPTGSSWQKAFVLDDIQISSGGGGSGASYAWTALQGGSSIATASSASTQVTVPTTAGTYQYRVTLTSGGCTTSQDVTVTVTGGTNPCAGISLSAQASPSTVSVGGSVNLSATCSGCSGGSTLYSTNFDGQEPNTDFQTDMGDAVRVLSNAQNVSDTYYCSVGDHSGNGGKLLRFNGDNSGTIWSKNLNVVANTTYTFSMWVRPVYDGTPASGNSPQTIQLKVNGGVQGSPTIAASNPGCGSGWVQLSVNWTANTTGSVPFTIQMPTGSSWQKAFVLDDIQISSGGGGSGANYEWRSLPGNAVIASSASTQVTPTAAGTYEYQVILTSGGCTISKNVSVTVTGGPTCDFTPTAAVSNDNPACNGTVSLSATCSGADCNGVAYSWTGPNGFTSNSQTVNATVPNSAGNYSYTVTASKSGCTKTATVAINTTCNTSTPRFYVGRAVPGVFDPELYQDNGDWYIRDKVTAANYSDNLQRIRRYHVNRAHVATGSLDGYKLGKRGGRYIVEMTRWHDNSWEKTTNGIEAFRMEFILPGSMNEPGAIETPTSFVPSENYIDNSVAMVPAHDTLKGKITVKVKYNQEHQDSQLKALGATHFGHNTSETDANKRQAITGEPWDGGPNPRNRTDFNQLSDDYIKSVARSQGVSALYFTDFETPQRGWDDYNISDDATLRKLYTYWEELMDKHQGKLVTNYYGNIVTNKGFPDVLGDGRPKPLAERFVGQYSDLNSAVTHAYRTFDRGNNVSASLRNLFNIWLVDDYGRETFDPNNQYELYRPYSMIHDSRIMRKVVNLTPNGSNKKIISYSWAGTDSDIGYKLKREIPGKGWVAHYARRYKSAAAVETETYLAYLVTDGYSPFHDQASSTNNPEQACPWGEDTWELPINGSPSPIQNRQNCYPREPQYYNEHVNLAEYKLSQVNDILAGGYAQDAPFNLTGSITSFLNEEGETAILHRAHNKQHIVLRKLKGNNEAFVMTANPFANESDKSTLTVKLAEGWIVTITTSGKWPTLKKFTR